MRWIVILGLVIPALLLAGCISSNTTAPVPVQPVITLTTPATTTTPAVVAGQMQINVTAKKSGTDVIVTYEGGQSAAYLTALDITIYNQNGQVVTRTMENPQPGDVYTFPYVGVPDPSSVDVVGVFTGGVQQTVLLMNL